MHGMMIIFDVVDRILGVGEKNRQREVLQMRSDVFIPLPQTHKTKKANLTGS
jgi:hypothetical protein